jgi:transcriptional accessory protein Tex/SPT6
MKKIVLSIVGISLLSSSLLAEAAENRDRQQSVKQLIGEVAKRETKEMSVVDELRHMFTDGKVSGQIRSMYMEYNEKKQHRYIRNCSWW